MPGAQRSRQPTDASTDPSFGVTVVVPTFNESATIEHVVDRCLRSVDCPTEILVVDDDSPDGTARVVREAYGGDRRVSVVRRTGDRSLSSAVAEGFRRASYGYCAVLDADLQHPPERLPALLAALEDGADIAIGSRYVDGGAIGNWSRYRRLVSRVGTHIARLVNRPLREIADPLSGFFAIRRSVVEGVELSPRGYKILQEILVKGAYDRVTEVPYVFSRRESGESNLTLDEYVHFLEQVLTLRRHDGPDRTASKEVAEQSPDSTRLDGGTGRADAASTAERGTARRPDRDRGRELDRARSTGDADDTGPDVALVSPYPPARDGVADYARRLIRGYESHAESVTVLGSGADTVESTDDRNEYRRVWEKDDPRSLLRLVRALWEIRTGVDIVHFNIKPTYFGSHNALRFLSLSVPLVGRVIPGYDVVVTMHDMLENVDADTLEEEIGLIERVGASVATQLVLCSGPVTVTTADYRDLLESEYPVADVTHVPHGVGQTDASDAVSTEPFRLLLFGYISPYKDYETVFEAFDDLRDRLDTVELWVAGDSHPDHAAYADRVRSRYASADGVRFLGYVAENDLSNVFADASLLVLPYETAPGVSGPFQEAKAHGVPVLVYDDEAVLRATVGTGGDAVTVPPGDPEALASTVEQLATDPDRLHRLADANTTAEDTTMADVARQIIDTARGSHD